MAGHAGAAAAPGLAPGRRPGGCGAAEEDLGRRGADGEMGGGQREKFLVFGFGFFGFWAGRWFLSF